tara:strand:+ start:289 stop:741 length:453 start_codon:yes stop_codon:yes gene_type:complete
MAKKRLGKKRQPTLKKQISSNLSKRANKLLEHYENIEALGKVGESNSETSQLLSKLGDVFNISEEVPKDTFNSKVEGVLGKLKTLKQLIVYNIMCTEDKKNFDTDEYREDRMFVTDTVFKIHATSDVDVNDLKKMNNLYKKHKQVKQLFD